MKYYPWLGKINKNKLKLNNQKKATINLRNKRKEWQNKSET